MPTLNGILVGKNYDQLMDKIPKYLSLNQCYFCHKIIRQKTMWEKHFYLFFNVDGNYIMI